MSKQPPPLSALNFRVKQPQHSWNQEERFILCCMRRFFDLKNDQITRIFNELYAAKIQSEGFSQGLKPTTIHTQWFDLGRRFHDDWKYVHHEIPFSQGPNHFQNLFEKIRAAASALHIGLVARARDLDVSRFDQMSTTRRRTQQAQPTLSTASTLSTAPRQAILVNPVEPRSKTALCPLEVTSNTNQEDPEPSRAAAAAEKVSDIYVSPDFG